jgi:hypothetical protein
MADTLFVLHRMISVRRDFDRAAVSTTKGAAYPTRFGEAKDSRAEFVVREASDDEAKEAARAQLADIDRRIEHLQREAKIAARVVQLRKQQRGDG